jgi:hypothetical protein
VTVAGEITLTGRFIACLVIIPVEQCFVPIPP